MDHGSAKNPGSKNLHYLAWLCTHVLTNDGTAPHSLNPSSLTAPP